MTTNLRDLSNSKLSEHLFYVWVDKTRAVDAIYDHASHGQERFSEILARLSAIESPLVTDYRKCNSAVILAEAEAARRVGPEIPAICYPTILLA